MNIKVVHIALTAEHSPELQRLSHVSERRSV